jgi:hypothetical protein
MIGCGLRRKEMAQLEFTHVQQRDGRWCIVDIRGKHGRVRTVPMPLEFRNLGVKCACLKSMIIV